MFNHQRLNCYCKALELAKRTPSIVNRWPQGYGYLTDQLKRAISSVVLNIAEGNGRTSPKERKRFFTISIGSINEVAAIIDIASALRLIRSEEYAYIQDQLLQVLKMTYKLS